MTADSAHTLDDGGAVEGVAFIKRLVGAWDCCGTCAGGVLAARDTATLNRAAQAIEAEAARLAAHHHVAGEEHARITGLAEWLAAVVRGLE